MSSSQFGPFCAFFCFVYTAIFQRLACYSVEFLPYLSRFFLFLEDWIKLFYQKYGTRKRLGLMKHRVTNVILSVNKNERVIHDRFGTYRNNTGVAAWMDCITQCCVFLSELTQNQLWKFCTCVSMLRCQNCSWNMFY